MPGKLGGEFVFYALLLWLLLSFCAAQARDDIGAHIDPCLEALTPLPLSTYERPMAQSTLLLSRDHHAGQDYFVQRVVELLVGRVSARFAVDAAGLGLWVQDWFPKFWYTDRQGQVYFRAQRPVEQAEALFRFYRHLKGRGAIEIPSDLFVEGGNIVEADHRVFVADSLGHNVSAGAEVMASLIQLEVNREIVILPSLPREQTGHLDMFATPIAKGRWMVSGSRNPARVAALNVVGETLQNIGYHVANVKNAGWDSGVFALSYTNAIVFADWVIIPQFSSYARYLSDRITQGHTHLQYRPQIDIREAFGDEMSQGTQSKWLSLIRDDDRHAVDTWVASGFKVIPIPLSPAIVESGGGLHCMIQHLPPKLAGLFR